MAGPTWEDDAADTAMIVRNADVLIDMIASTAHERSLPDLTDVLGWHAALYVGCRAPVSGYIGRLRGEVSVPELVGYEVGIGPFLADGLPAGTGMPSWDVADRVDVLLPAVHAGLQRLDDLLPVGRPPRTVDELDAVVRLTAIVHGEWVRIHPFVNGNGRTARTWAAFIALRYSLPVFVTAKPRPDDVAYARAAHDSMGRPPDYTGDHAATIAVFTHLLSLALLR